MSNIALVMPSIREANLKTFIDAWRPTGLFDRVDFILIEDNPTKTFECPDAKFHASWTEIDNNASWAEQVIPRRSDTVRSYGYWIAWRTGYEYIMTLDDDCLPHADFPNLDQSHIEMLRPRTKWFNTLTGGRPRGIPYGNLGQRDVMLNHGLWTGTLDYDAPQQLVAPFPENHSFDNRVVTPGAYFPMCGMNLMWKRDMTVLMYHLLMGQRKRGPTLEKYPFDRFGDIWCGIFMKKVADHLRWNVTTGIPYINHSRASNPFTNLRKEANGIEVNESLWQQVDCIKLTGTDAVECYTELAYAVYKLGGEHDEYWKELGTSMVLWSNLFTA